MKNSFTISSKRISIFIALLTINMAVAQQSGRQPSSPTAIPRPSSRQPAAATQAKSNSATPAIPYDNNPNGLNFQEASADLVIMDYAMRTGRTVIKDPATPNTTITLRSTPEIKLTDEQYLMAIKTALNMHGIAIVPKGDTFLYVYPSAELAKRGLETSIITDTSDEKTKSPEDGSFVTKLIQLNHIDLSEAKTIIDGFVRNGSMIQTFERSNSIRITDSAENVNRIVEMIAYLDRPIPALEEPNIIKIRYAKATELKDRLMEIVKDAQESEEKTSQKTTTERLSGAPGTVTRNLPNGVSLPSRRNQPPTPNTASNASVDSLIAEAQRGILRGKVSIFADERTNILIIITRKENMIFFNKLIEVLDVPTAPDYLVEVLRLEHAVAEDIANLLDQLISNSNSSKNDSSSTVNRNDTSSSRSSSLDKAARDASSRSNANNIASDAKNKIGQLDTENIKILADERTNSLVIMASASDMVSLKNIISHMDIMLSQVVIETAIISVTFTDSNETGMDWVQRAMIAGKSKDGTGPSIAFATSGGGGNSKALNPLNMTSTDSFGSVPAGGVNFLATLFDFNIDVIFRAIQTDDRSRLMSSPRITTMDNKEAILEATERIYWKEGTTHYNDADYVSDNIKNEDVGIKLSVTPRINKKGFITLTIEQEIESHDGYMTIGGEQYPNLTSRKMGADVAVQSGQTVVLGGLAQNRMTRSQSKVPLLGSIPLLGRLFRYDKEENQRTDIIVFLTPRVIDTPEQIEDDSRKIKSYLDTNGVWDSGWSNSPIADPISEKQRARVINNSRNTVVAPNIPLTGYLSNTNEENGFESYSDYAEKNNTKTKYPYVHFSKTESLKELPNGVVLPNASANKTIANENTTIEKAEEQNSIQEEPKNEEQQDLSKEQNIDTNPIDKKIEEILKD